MVPSQGVKQEFCGALDRVAEQMLEQRLNKLLVKAKHQDLTDSDKVNLRKLLTMKREHV